MSAGILAIWNDCAPGSEAEYEHWYRTEHLAERVGVDGFVAGWRYVAVDAQPRYFTHYTTEAVDVLFSPAYEERMNNPSPLTQAVMSGVFRNCTRTICERVLRIGDARGAFAVVAQFSDTQDIDALSSFVQATSAQEDVLRAEVWVAAAVPLRETSFAEVEIRGPDRAIAACVLIETATEGDAHSIVRGRSAQLAGADQVGLYRLMCSLSQGDLRTT
ncbi:MAG: hypothetical protein ACI9DC_003878 [Gammaproteobacteria bacterium]|jgi:hypothetical protein